MKRKTSEEYQILGNYGYGWERLCSEENLKQAKKTFREYLENDHDIGMFKIVKKRVRLEAQ